MNPNIFVSHSEKALENQFGDWFIAHIDGSQTPTLRAFYTEIANVLEFPNDFGYNLDALNDSLNDLQWLDEDRIVLYVTHTDQWISHERDPNKIGSVLAILEATAEDWKWLDDDQPIDPKAFKIVLEDSPRIRQLLNADQIAYTELS